MIAPLDGCGNLLLGALPPAEFTELAPLLERVPLETGQTIVRQGDPISLLHFPEAGIVSLADVLSDDKRVEVALVGREGMTNAQLLLGCEEAPHEAVVQIGGGTALTICALSFRTFCEDRPAANSVFLRFIHVLTVQTSRTLASNLHQSVESRLARWLLMLHDRIDGNVIRVFHAHLGAIIGVRRATVTDGLHRLEGLGLVRSYRRRIEVRDRPGLERLAADSYGLAEVKYVDLIAPFGRRVQGSEIAQA